MALFPMNGQNKVCSTEVLLLCELKNISKRFSQLEEQAAIDRMNLVQMAHKLEAQERKSTSGTVNNSVISQNTQVRNLVVKTSSNQHGIDQHTSHMSHTNVTPFEASVDRGHGGACQKNSSHPKHLNPLKVNQTTAITSSPTSNAVSSTFNHISNASQFQSSQVGSQGVLQRFPEMQTLDASYTASHNRLSLYNNRYDHEACEQAIGVSPLYSTGYSGSVNKTTYSHKQQQPLGSTLRSDSSAVQQHILQEQDGKPIIPFTCNKSNDHEWQNMMLKHVCQFCLSN